ncbi:MAG: universal stress protein [Gammaproteobacteria bacterium]|nr:universal stress protein [Gammaproteobacteria bacterium]MBU1602793.1 universal stress protein [Gammaproteobacteria bacterium]MBU2432465.1 universal stress protein [Gammaproteobacteria bacterium]MBU2448992.1 universal stress protein [Gammaproteobacteria bacterium]
MKSVLLPVDGSKHAFAAALYLVQFAKLHGDLEVHVLNVEPQPVAWQTHGMEEDAIERHLAARANIVQKPVVAALSEAGIRHKTHVRLGDTAEIIVALADELGCDTIVMGTRGLGGLAALALGSVTRKVLHLANKPVVCIKADDD